MKIINMTALVLVLFLFGGCLTTNKNKKDKPKNIETYQLDLDNDMVVELIEVENRFITHGDILVKITKPNRKKDEGPKVFNFAISGQLSKVEFSDMGCDGSKQMLIYYDTANNFMHVVIYKFKNDKVSQIFLANSNCDIETDFTTVPRVKIAKNINGGRDCSRTPRGNEWESWAWDGEKFVKEQ